MFDCIELAKIRRESMPKIIELKSIYQWFLLFSNELLFVKTQTLR